MSTADIGRVRATRVERLIAGGRVVLGSFSLLALWLDPLEPAARTRAASGLIAAYLVIALAVLAVVLRRSTPPKYLGLAGHAFDLVMFGFVVLSTRGSNSPFFAFFVFAMVSAALRWQWQGIQLTAGAALGTLLGSGLWAVLVLAPGFELNQLIFRAASLVVIAVLLGYLSDHEKRLRDEVSRMTAAAERIRFARDLHDGIVQSLTGAALRLRTLPAQFDRSPEAARRSVEEVGDLIEEEQRELRRFVEELQAGHEARPRPLSERLPEILSRVERHWGLSVDCTADLEGAAISPSMAEEVSRMVHEAVVNSARHGGASSASVRLNVENRRLAITIEDDGHGFPFRGRYRLADLERQHRGPRSLQGRISALGGDLTLQSSERGARLEISIPLGTEAA